MIVSPAPGRCLTEPEPGGCRIKDRTVGQVARYVGWVKRNLAESTDTVEGMIIAREAYPQIQYALDVVRE